jgi:hypothetical protein
VPGGGYAPPKFQRAITDLLLASDGALSTRPGVVAVAALDAPRSAYAYAGALYLHVGTTILRRVLATGVTTIAATGISDAQPVAWCEHQGMLRWTDGVTSGRFTDAGVLLPELPPAPTPGVTTPAGALPPGRYLVSITWVDAAGVQSGCAASAVVDLDGAKSLSVTAPAFPAGAVAARLWCSRANGPPVFVGTYTTDLWPVAITAEPTATTLLTAVGLSPLPPGAGLTTRGGFLVVWAGDLLSFSAGSWTHHHDPRRHSIRFGGAILGAVGVEGGIWVTTAAGMRWVEGPQLDKARPNVRTDSRQYARGAGLVPAELTKLNTDKPVAVFASSEGLVFGTADGQLVAPMRESQRWEVDGKTASFAVWERAGEKYLVVGGVQ